MWVRTTNGRLINLDHVAVVRAEKSPARHRGADYEGAPARPDTWNVAALNVGGLLVAFLATGLESEALADKVVALVWSDIPVEESISTPAPRPKRSSR